MRAYFNEAINFTLYALRSDDLTNNLVLPDEAEAIYLFENYPTKDQIVGGTGYLRDLGTEWESTADGYGKVIAIEPIEGNDPRHEQNYYLGILAKLNPENDEGSVIVRSLLLTWVRTQISKLLIYPADCYRIAPSIPKFFQEHESIMYGEILNAIDAAVDNIQLKFSQKQVDYSMITNPSQLKLAAIHLALSIFYRSESRDVNDIYLENSKFHKQESTDIFKSLRLDVDQDLDGQPEQIRQPGVRLMRLLS